MDNVKFFICNKNRKINFQSRCVEAQKIDGFIKSEAVFGG